MERNLVTQEDETSPSSIKNTKFHQQLIIGTAENDNKINVNEENSLLSKRQKKKLIKIAEWEIKKKIKRLKEREKYKQKRLDAIEKGEPARIGPSRKELKRNKAAISSNKLKVAVDLNFDELMIDKDIGKCVKQLLRIYTINRRSKSPVQLYFTGIQENGRIHKCLEKNDGYENWDVKWEFNKSYHEIYDNHQIVYLSSESSNSLEVLDENSLYVIGGIVDHNHHKGLCHHRAQLLDIKTARLPINEHVDIKSRQVLSTVHVFEMLLRVSEGKPWSDVIFQILPMRKGAKLKLPSLNLNISNDDNEENDENDDDEDDGVDIGGEKDNLNVQNIQNANHPDVTE